jgi:hypothetical protein
MFSKIKNWFFKTDNISGRSAACLFSMYATAGSIWWLYEMECDTWSDLGIAALLIVSTIVFLAVFWTMIEYIIKNDPL